MDTIIRTGICSFGMSGQLFQAPFLASHPGFDLAAIVERHRQDSRETYPQATLYRSVEALLEDATIGLVIVNTPVQTHYEYARAALLAGKHVVVEKPFTVTSREGMELDELARERDLLLSVYQNRRYDGDFRAVRSVLRQGWLGEVREMEMRFDRYRPGASGKQHKEGSLPGAGTLYDLGPHLIDQALRFFGWPRAVFADIWIMRQDVYADDYFELLFYYDRLRVRIKSTCIARESYPAYIVHGMKGSFLQQRSDRQEKALMEGVLPTQASWCPPPAEPDGLLHAEIDGSVVRRSTTSEAGNYMGFFDDLYRALTGQGENPVPAADGIATIRLIEAARQSAAEGKIISVA
ncbi:MAG TPA: Gfo/Idh/MocA family oxidoreductase [Chitinophagaceae bacterium]|nr:Gfo/Idh/MocA family oxidoreductase [Chitinophagaceae bacterium]